MNLETLKTHLRVDHCDDDTYIEMLYEAVKEQAEGYLDATLVDALAGGDREVLITKSIEVALLVGVAYLYDNRGDYANDQQSVKEHKLPNAFHALLINKRNFANVSE